MRELTFLLNAALVLVGGYAAGWLAGVRRQSASGLCN
jgi:hypothetical protein